VCSMLKKHTEKSATAGASPIPAGLFTTPQVARALQVSERSVTNYRENGLLPYVKLGKSIRFVWADVQAAIVRQTKGAA
jgi:predicted DNA-binding transcriptional regulator AlpA